MIDNSKQRVPLLLMELKCCEKLKSDMKGIIIILQLVLNTIIIYNIN